MALFAAAVTVGLLSFGPMTSSLQDTAGAEASRGACLVNGGDNIIPQALFLENRSVSNINNTGLNVSIHGERVRIFSDTDQGRNTRIDWLVDQSADLDIDLKFAIYRDEVVLFWRETYRHRIFRQGMFRLEGESLVSICTGRGGSTAYD